MTDQIEVGRVIFPKDTPDLWRVQTLKSHVDNVTRLAKLWDNNCAFQGCPYDLSQTRNKVIQAAKIHDMAKPVKFRLGYQQNRITHKWGWTYSFAGHRFEAFDPDPYAQTLAQLHHEYSVAGITKHMAQLKLNEKTEPFANHLPLDLYALEMCDQIEATLACTALEDKDPEARVFMDFQFNWPDRDKLDFQIEPFVFEKQKPVRLPIEYLEVAPPHDKRLAVENTTDDGKRRELLRDIQHWLLAQLHENPPPSIQTKEVTIWPWI
jgi:CRISPR-associated endonuclease/helicase Cas3